MRTLSLLLFFCCITQSLLGQSRLQKAVNDFARASDLKAASVGIAVVDVQSGQTIAAYEADRSLIPGSNLKVLTTATAIGILGPNFRYTTQLAYGGRIDQQGVLQGNLFIIGSGDPSLGAPEWEATINLEELIKRWRLAIQQAGIRRISGRIIGDASAMTNNPEGDTWQWYDIGNYYGAGTYGLNLHENLYYLRLGQKSQLGSQPDISKVEPEVPGLRWTNLLESAARGTGDNSYIYGAPGTYERTIRGTIPVGRGIFTVKGSLPDPPLFAAQQLSAALESIGISCGGPPGTNAQLVAPSEVKSIYQHRSPSLGEIVRRTNEKSVNLYAESMFHSIGARGNDDASALIASFWEDRGLDLGGLFIEDGSGLSARNGVTTNFLAQMLRKAYLDPKIKESFWTSLPIAGRTASLRNAMKGTAAEGRLRAKSGTLKRVRGFTGYAETRDGRLLAFSILVNNFPGKGSDMRRRLYQLMIKFCE